MSSSTGAIGASLFPARQRHRLPAVHGTTLAGAPLALRDLAGHGVLVVNVWASWCSSCRDESAALATLARTAPAGTTFVGIDEQDATGAARAFVTTTGSSYPQLSDPDGSILAQLSVLPSSGIPSTLVVDRNSRMAARYVGAVTRPALLELIGRVRAESSDAATH